MLVRRKGKVKHSCSKHGRTKMETWYHRLYPGIHLLLGLVTSESRSSKGVGFHHLTPRVIPRVTLTWRMMLTMKRWKIDPHKKDPEQSLVLQQHMKGQQSHVQFQSLAQSSER
jgi:hypothetical protein